MRINRQIIILITSTIFIANFVILIKLNQKSSSRTYKQPERDKILQSSYNMIMEANKYRNLTGDAKLSADKGKLRTYKQPEKDQIHQSSDNMIMEANKYKNLTGDAKLSADKDLKDTSEIHMNSHEDLLDENSEKQVGNVNTNNSFQTVEIEQRNETSKEVSLDGPISPLSAKEKTMSDVMQSVHGTKRLHFMERMIGRKMEHGGKNCNKTLPQAIIIGVMKCGTDTFTTFLSLHPDIAMELNLAAVLFFNYYYDKGLDWYRDQMPCSKKGQITMEKSPQYFGRKQVPERIHNMNSSVKLIIIVREPVSRCVSHYSHVQDVNPGSIRSTFKEAVFAKNGEIDNASTLILPSLYGQHIQRWLEYFSLEQIHIVDGDNFKKHPVEELRRTEKFLGLKPFFNEDDFVYNAKKGFYCIKRTGEHGCMSKGKGRRHPEIDKSLLDKMRTFFKPWNDMFFKTVKRKFDW